MPSTVRTSTRGYGTAHQRARARWKKLVDAGGVECARCHKPIAPGSEWDLDHDDRDRSRYLGASHAACNRSAGGTKGRDETRAIYVPSLDW